MTNKKTTSYITDFGTITDISEVRTIQVCNDTGRLYCNWVPSRTAILPASRNPYKDMMYIVVSDAKLDGKPVELMYRVDIIDEFDDVADDADDKGTGTTYVIFNRIDFYVLKEHAVENGLEHKEDNIFSLKKSGCNFQEYILRNCITWYREPFFGKPSIVTSAPFVF